MSDLILVAPAGVSSVVDLRGVRHAVVNGRVTVDSNQTGPLIAAGFYVATSVGAAGSTGATGSSGQTGATGP